MKGALIKVSQRSMDDWYWTRLDHQTLYICRPNGILPLIISVNMLSIMLWEFCSFVVYNNFLLQLEGVIGMKLLSGWNSVRLISSSILLCSVVLASYRVVPNKTLTLHIFFAAMFSPNMMEKIRRHTSVFCSKQVNAPPTLYFCDKSTPIFALWFLRCNATRL